MKTCTACKIEQPFDNFHQRSDSNDGHAHRCKVCSKKYSKIYYASHKDENSEKCKQWRLINKKKKSSYQKYYYKKNIDKWQNRDPEVSKSICRKYRQKLKEKVINAYGGRCLCCNEDCLDFLTIEHTLHDGKNHRQRVGSVYRDLKNRHFPKNIGIAVLCWNCQMATRFGDSCPHKGVSK